MKQIPLSGKHGVGKFALVDDDDYKGLIKHKWHLFTDGHTQYAKRHIWIKGEKKHSKITMHRQIMNPSALMHIDHIDHDGLNNQKQNLRECTKSENTRNRGKYLSKYSSKYKGVCWEKESGSWRVCIKVDNKQISIGRFHNEIEAAKARDKAAVKHHGAFANLNFKP
jgi:hypothetical protein